MMFLRHPAWLWLKKHDKDRLPPVDDNTQAIFDAGHMLEQYAERLFPGGVTLGFNDYNEYLSLPKRTSEALENGAKTIFQGRFEDSSITFICDIVDIVGDKEVDLYEIKSSTKAKQEHEYDLAFQMVVLEECGYRVRDIKVIHVNNEYVRNGDINPKELTAITDITESVKSKRVFTREKILAAINVANLTKCPDITPAHARLGSFAEWLEIYKTLANTKPGSIYDLCGLNAQSTAELERLGIKGLIDIPDGFALNPKQKSQLKATKQNEPIIDKPKIKQYLSELEYPLYLFDYETLASIVPYFDGMQPYKQYPFQYSLHILDKPDGKLKHVDFLQKENASPLQALSETLKSQIGDTGSVITWNMGFEKSCNTLIGTMLPEYAEFYEKLNERIVDLMIPVSKGWYIDKDFLGSASIKNVLPVLVPELSYKVLGIKEGGAAQRLWMEAVLDGKRDGEKDQILSDLLEYCGLDTMAMVEIYRKLLAL